MYLYNFKIWYSYNNKTYEKIYSKFCRYPKKTRLYKNLMQQLDKEKIFKLEIYKAV